MSLKTDDSFEMATDTLPLETIIVGTAGPGKRRTHKPEAIRWQCI